MKLWLPFLLAVFVIAAAPVAEKPAWKAGAASAKITPEKSMWMAGYAARTKPSEGVELDLSRRPLCSQMKAGPSLRW
jgi:neutral ceramidase